MGHDDDEKTLSFNLKPWNRGIKNEEIISDLQQVARRLGKDSLTSDEHKEWGRCSDFLIRARFGSWNSALEEAGLIVLRQMGITNDELYENIEKVWIALGRQPKREEIAFPLSRYSKGTYEKRFGGWRKALEAFIRFINEQDVEVSSKQLIEPMQQKRRTTRYPSLRLRFRVMQRDNFKCQHCGRSPATHAGVELHIDHKEPWSKGGETEFDNLLTLCSDCNLGKGDLSTA
jgi:predicted restriction endonuclease